MEVVAADRAAGETMAVLVGVGKARVAGEKARVAVEKAGVAAGLAAPGVLG
jgi:ABC-type phosphate transport system permease subunit